MLGSLQANVARLLGHSNDPLGLISPEQLKTVLRSIEGKYNALRDENTRLKNTLSDLREAQAQLESEREQAKNEAQRVENDELTRLRSEFAVVKQATEVLRLELTRSETDAENLRRENARAEAVAETLRTELTKAQGATDSWRLELLEIQNDAERLRTELAATQAAKAAMQEALAQQVEQQEAELQACYQELLSLRNQEPDMTALEALQSQLELAQQEKSEMSATLAEAREANQALEAQLLEAAADTKTQERLEATETEKARLIQQVGTLQAECDRLKSELQRSQAAAYRPTPAEARPEANVSPEERRRLIAQLISGKSS